MDPNFLENQPKFQNQRKTKLLTEYTCIIFLAEILHFGVLHGCHLPPRNTGHWKPYSVLVIKCQGEREDKTRCISRYNIKIQIFVSKENRPKYTSKRQFISLLLSISLVYQTGTCACSFNLITLLK